MNSTPLANRLTIALFGKRNVGKSSLINALTGQNTAVISEIPGTTTDPVYKAMELLPIGPVVLIDTAGLDDTGALGELRMEKTYEVLRKSDLAVVVVSAAEGPGHFETKFIQDLKRRKIPSLCVLNKSDLLSFPVEQLPHLEQELGIPVIQASASAGYGIAEVKERIIQHADYDKKEPSLVSDLIKPGETAVLVTPIDQSAPKGRLILPQQQTIRDILECDARVLITKEHGLKAALESLRQKPAIVITDSQAFQQVSADTPADIPLTSFSILFARQKTDLAELVRGLAKIAALHSGDKVLIMEGCTHHRQSDDIGTVKIPRWIRRIAGEEIDFAWASGGTYPKDIEKYDVIVHCGGCMLNRREMRYRVDLARERGVAITNYGLLIAYVQGILKRTLGPFPEARPALEEAGL
ncbi:MAG: [FeFe] hydrogenase H-cluster maturation GTPase HydF [Clostridia bacterium]|nr:[FeFe] hydrogenase H-cluster maturation GTPase HydF [Clostridia bacterium]